MVCWASDEAQALDHRRHHEPRSTQARTQEETPMTKRRATIVLVEMLIAAALAFAVVVTFRAMARAQVNFTDENGRYSGSMTTHGNQSTFTDSNGHFSGSAITHGNTTEFYDARGHHSGSATTQGTPSHPLAGVNGSSPFGRGGGRR